MKLIGELHARECRSSLKIRFGRLASASTRLLIVSRKAETLLGIRHSNVGMTGHTGIRISCLPRLQANDPSNAIHNAYFRPLSGGLIPEAAV